MLPAKQCLEPFDCSVFGTDDRLVMDVELIFFEGLPQCDFKDAAFLGMGVKLWLIGVVRAAALVLRPIEREIGRADQHFNRTPVTRADSRPDRRADVERVLIDFIWFRQCLDDAARQAKHAGRVTCIAHDDAELVTAEPTAHILIGHQPLQPFGNTGQQAVTDRVAEGIIDLFEPVEIDHHKGTTSAPALGFGHGFAKGLGDLQAVGQAGQRVETRHVVDLVGGAALRGHVRSHTAKPQERPVFIMTR